MPTRKVTEWNSIRRLVEPKDDCLKHSKVKFKAMATTDSKKTTPVTKDEKADTKDVKVSTATSSKGEAQGSMDGRLTNPTEVQDDVPVNQKKSKNSGRRESEARTGFKKAAGTPLPEEDVDASDDEDQNVGKIKAREVQVDEDSEADDEEDSDDDDIPEGMTKGSWKVWKARIKDIEDREKAIEDLETLAEG